MVDFEIKKSRYIAAALATLIIFIGGLGIGYMFASETSEQFSAVEGNLKTKLTSLNLQNELTSEFICETNIFDITEEKTELGQKLESLEEQFGKDDERIISMKKRYMLLSVRQFLFLKKYNAECDNQYIPILFFYSNEENVSASESQGYVLDYIYNNFKERVSIYAFDVDINDPVLNTLKKVYGIGSVPSVVVNGTTYGGLRDNSEMMDILLNETDLQTELTESIETNMTDNISAENLSTNSSHLG